MDVEKVLVSDYPPKQIMDKIDKIEKKIDRIEKKLDDHISLIMSAYRPLMKPLDKLKDWMK